MIKRNNKQGRKKKVIFGILISIVICICMISYVAITRIGIAQTKPYQLTLDSIEYQNSYESDFECLYKELKSNYSLLSYKEELLHFNFDELYQEYANQIKNISNDKDFYLLCCSFISCLKDGHMSFRQYNADKVYGHPYKDQMAEAIAIREIESKNIIVGNCFKQELNGYEVKSINGIPFKEIVDTMVGIYYNSCFDLGARQSIVSHHYMAYFDFYCIEPPKKLVYHLEGPHGEQEEITLASQIDYSQMPFYAVDINLALDCRELPRYTMLDQIGYIRIDTFDAPKNKIISTYETALTDFREKNIKGLIIDVRNNGGGNESFRTIVDSLAQGRLDSIIYHYKQSQHFMEIYPLRFLWDKLCSDQVDIPTEENYSSWRSWKIRGSKDTYLEDIPVVILVNESIFSSTDSLVYYCKENGLATIIGNNYAYSGSGLSTQFILPSKKYVMSYGMQETCNSSGIPLENLEDRPDIVVSITREDILNNYDSQLEKAKAIINSYY